jgi:hypothetical protein
VFRQRAREIGQIDFRVSKLNAPRRPFRPTAQRDNGYTNQRNECGRPKWQAPRAKFMRSNVPLAGFSERMENPTSVLVISEVDVSKVAHLAAISVILRGLGGNPALQIHHGLIANQIATAMMVATTAHHITGVTCFELPLRGESLAAWSNFWFIRSAFGSEQL